MLTSFRTSSRLPMRGSPEGPGGVGESLDSWICRTAALAVRYMMEEASSTTPSCRMGERPDNASGNSELDIVATRFQWHHETVGRAGWAPSCTTLLGLLSPQPMHPMGEGLGACGRSGTLGPRENRHWYDRTSTCRI